MGNAHSKTPATFRRHVYLGHGGIDVEGLRVVHVGDDHLVERGPRCVDCVVLEDGDSERPEDQIGSHCEPSRFSASSPFVSPLRSV